jgi:hypothetical protein
MPPCGAARRPAGDIKKRVFPAAVTAAFRLPGAVCRTATAMAAHGTTPADDRSEPDRRERPEPTETPLTGGPDRPALTPWLTVNAVPEAGLLKGVRSTFRAGLVVGHRTKPSAALKLRARISRNLRVGVICSGRFLRVRVEGLPSGSSAVEARRTQTEGRIAKSAQVGSITSATLVGISAFS